MPVGDLFGELNFSMAGIGTTLTLIFIIFLLFIMVIAIIAFFVIRKRKVNVNLFQERSGEGNYSFVNLNGKRKYKDGSVFMRLWKVGVIDKIIPDIGTDYIHQDKHGKDIINLVMDNRGFIHKVKFPKLDKILEFMIFEKLLSELKENKIGNPVTIATKSVDAIFERFSSLKKEYIKENPEYDIVGTPNIHETVDFITNQIKEAKSQFGNFMERHGAVVIFGGAMVGAIMLLVMAMIFSQKILGG